MGKTYMDLGNLDEAASYFSQAIAIQPGLADAYFHLGLVRADQGNIQEATSHFRQALNLDPAHGEAQQHLTALTEN
jgi:tetratricopeptide (TPR) repeat protein